MKTILLILSGLLFSMSAFSANTDNLQKAMVTDARSLEKNESSKDIRIGDFIEVTVWNFDSLCQSHSPDSLILIIDGIALPDIHPYLIKKDTGSYSKVVFCLSHELSISKLKPLFRTIFSKRIVTMSVGFKNEVPTKSSMKGINLYIVDRTFLWLTIILCILFVAILIFYSKRSTLIRTGIIVSSPYSLARMQLAFWTIVCAMSYFYLWMVTSEIPTLPESVLALLGISLATRGTAKMIELNVPVDRTAQISKGFVTDLLSDGNSVNIQRFQMMVWTIVLGIIFIRSVIVSQMMPDFDVNILVLMGISSGTYVLLKVPENKEMNQQAQKSQVDQQNNSNTQTPQTN